jgi:hypothetical protein
MTDAKPNLGRFGSFGRGVTPEQAKDIEALGYGAVWVGGSPPAELDWVEPILEKTDHASGRHRHRQYLDRGRRTCLRSPSTASTKPTRAASCWHRRRPPRGASAVPQAHRCAERVPRQARRVRRAEEPPRGRRARPAGAQAVRERAAGAHPYLTTPEHTAEARELIGPDAFIAPEHKVVLTTDVEKAHAVGRKALEIYLNLTNYLNSWKRLGLHDEDVAKPGSDRLVDAVVAYGTVDAIAARLKEHLDAGADHVPVQVLTSPDKLVPALAELAGPLGLQ